MLRGSCIIVVQGIVTLVNWQWSDVTSLAPLHKVPSKEKKVRFILTPPTAYSFYEIYLSIHNIGLVLL